jgi:hypothetical protein
MGPLPIFFPKENGVVVLLSDPLKGQSSDNFLEFNRIISVLSAFALGVFRIAKWLISMIFKSKR